jgi:aspartyl-tRNA(Asn)/glutamyl-tRNA(Gln) amidotransferase subunit A
MPAAPLASQTIHELRARIAEGAVSPRELLEDLLARIERLNPSVRAYTPAMQPERLSRQLDTLPARPSGKLHGIPITIKSNICVSGEETNCCSRILQGFRPPYDAAVVERLRREGAVIVPCANMDEFAFGSSTENSAAGPTRNPWKTDRVPGGSSGGSAAAVAADLAVAALGSDTGGSIRQPASFCGVVGLKPTYGRVSRYGLVAFASSLDQIGPLTKDVRDAAILLSVIAGRDERDSTSAPVDVPDYEAKLAGPLKGLRLGIPALPAGANDEVKQAVDGAREALQRLGLEAVGIELPHLDKVIETYYIIATAEASSNLARYDGVQYGLRQDGRTLMDMYLDTRTAGFGAEAKRRILLGTYVLSQGYYDAYYLKGMKVRTLIKQGFDEAFQRCDVLIMPTAPTPAFRLGEKLSDPLQMYLSDIYTISANLAGVPALSLPCGLSGDGLPIGVQLLAAPFREDVLLRAAHAYEQATDWHSRKPVVGRS